MSLLRFRPDRLNRLKVHVGDPSLLLGELAVRYGLLRREELDAAIDRREEDRALTEQRGEPFDRPLDPYLADLLHPDELAWLHRQAAGEPSPSIGKYNPIRRLGEGAMAEVFQAYDCELGRLVALKLLKAPTDSLAQRFVREARMAARLSHPHIVSIFDSGVADGRHYIALQFIDGPSLEGLRLPVRDAMAILRDVSLAVHFAHSHSVLHRDIKPSNILLDRSRRHPFVADFGLAKSLDRGSSLTLSGAIVGSPSYMAPEQALGRPELVGPCTDVYGLGATLFELLTGQPPHVGKSFPEVLQKLSSQDPRFPPPFDRSLHRDVRTICLKALEKDLSRRYASAEELARDIDRYLAGEPIHARPPGLLQRARRWVRRHRLVAAVFAVALAGALAFAVKALTDARADARRQEALAVLGAARSLLESYEMEHLVRPLPAGERERLRERVLRMVEAGRKSDPSCAESYAVEGKLWEISGDHEIALAMYTRALALDPGSVMARSCRAFLLGMQEFQQTRLQFVTPSGAHPAPRWSPATEMPRLAQALEDLAFLEQAYRGGSLGEEDFRLLSGLGKLVQQDFEGAIQDLERVEGRNRFLGYRAMFLGIARWARGDLQGAARELDDASERMPANPSVHVYRGQAYYYLATSRGAPPEETEMLLRRGLGSLDRAAEVGAEAPESLPDLLNIRSQIWRKIAEVEVAQGRPAEESFLRGLEDIEEALRQNPDKAIYHVTRANLLLRWGLHGEAWEAESSMERYRQAVEAYSRAIERDPDFPGTSYGRAQARSRLLSLGFFDDEEDLAAVFEEILADCSEDIRRRPDSLDAMGLRAQIPRIRADRADPSSDAARRDLEAALDDWNHILAEMPARAGALRERGIVHARLQRIDDALRDWEEAVRLDPSLRAELGPAIDRILRDREF